MSDGGKGSGRRVEDLEKIRSNWDLIDWGKKTTTYNESVAKSISKTGQENLKNIVETLGDQGVDCPCNEGCGCESLYSLKD